MGEHSRIVDKELLLSAARDRIRKMRKQEFSKKKVIKELGKTTIGDVISHEQMK